MLSVADIFSIGVGPSSSHTVGPMRAGYAFVQLLRSQKLLTSVERIEVTLSGSLAQTGRGHGTDRAVFAGLEGYEPETVNPRHVIFDLERACESQRIMLGGEHYIHFSEQDIVFDMWSKPTLHPNKLCCKAYGNSGRDDSSTSECIAEQTYYSVGGGFIATEEDLLDVANKDFQRNNRENSRTDITESDNNGTSISSVPYPFSTAQELLSLCEENQCSIADIVWENECAIRTPEEVKAIIRHIWETMRYCVHAGCTSEEHELPGGLHVPRRAPKLFSRLLGDGVSPFEDFTHPMSPEQRFDALNKHGVANAEWVDLFAMAVNEENAGGGKIVTAPTNGSAGIIPAVLHYYWWFVPNADEQGIVNFLLTATAIGYLFKKNASISGAEVGCQGEVGSACSMAAGGLCAVMGGTPAQVENAAEIGIEHNLGLTCDPIGGLVQIPCIERNAMAANTAINATRMALLGDGTHIVSLDSAIKTMKDTGLDMLSKYKETSNGGLAVNVPEC